MKGVTSLSLETSYGKSRLREYRSEITVFAEILDVVKEIGMQGIIISAIARIVNLAHYSALEKCQKLVDAGLLEQIRTGKKRLFRISTKGIEYLVEYQRFQEITKKINLKL